MHASSQPSAAGTVWLCELAISVVHEPQTAIDTADMKFSILCRQKLGSRLELYFTFRLANGGRLVMHGEVEDFAMLLSAV